MKQKLLRNFLKAAKKQAGFSIIEILVALTLLGIVGTFVAGKIFDQLKEGQISATTIQMQNFKARLQEFRRHCGSYPTEEQGLEALISKPTTGKECKRYAPNGYIEAEDVPVDPWDEEYIYKSDGKTFTIISIGPDMEEGTEDDIEFPTKKK
jgi:general secretion pathway protein G